MQERKFNTKNFIRTCSEPKHHPLSMELVIQPDMQYIINPSPDPTVGNVLVVGVRLEVNLNWFEGPTTSVEIQK
jgi:carbohydrate-selective porin OprB